MCVSVCMSPCVHRSTDPTHCSPHTIHRPCPHTQAPPPPIVPVSPKRTHAFFCTRHTSLPAAFPQEGRGNGKKEKKKTGRQEIEALIHVPRKPRQAVREAEVVDH